MVNMLTLNIEHRLFVFIVISPSKPWLPNKRWCPEICCKFVGLGPISMQNFYLQHCSCLVFRFPNLTIIITQKTISRSSWSRAKRIVDYWLLIVDYWLLIVDCWLFDCLIVDCWLLIVDWWLLIVDRWSLIVDCWSLIVDCWSLIVDRWSLIVDRWSLIVDRWSLFVNFWLLFVDRWLLIVVHC